MFCGNIQQLAYVIIDWLSEVYNVGYVDVDYVYGDDEFFYDGVMVYGVCLNYIDKIYYYCFDQKVELGIYQFWWCFNDQDVVIVNGNYFKVKWQIVVIDF